MAQRPPTSNPFEDRRDAQVHEMPGAPPRCTSRKSTASASSTSPFREKCPQVLLQRAAAGRQDRPKRRRSPRRTIQRSARPNVPSAASSSSSSATRPARLSARLRSLPRRADAAAREYPRRDLGHCGKTPRRLPRGREAGRACRSSSGFGADLKQAVLREDMKSPPGFATRSRDCKRRQARPRRKRIVLFPLPAFGGRGLGWGEGAAPLGAAISLSRCPERRVRVGETAV